MKLAKVQQADGSIAVGSIDGDQFTAFDMSGEHKTLADILESGNPSEVAAGLASAGTATTVSVESCLPPIDDQEVWAAGVTYKKSQTARMEESETSASCYDLVYNSDRPEIFFKATPHRVVGFGQGVRIREDSKWNVPEPEITLVLTSNLELVGFTCGNDMSSRDIEGENPLYLPQAKMYNQSCALGPWITLVDAMPPREEIGIKLSIVRDGSEAFGGTSGVAQMARSFENLIGYLARDNTYPNGAFLLTGTGIVPDSDFTLLPGDEVSISIDGIGTLTNPVVQG